MRRVHHANHFYGHAHILAEYCGLDETHPPRIHGFLQHGWNIGDGLSPNQPYLPGSPIFLWSDQTRRRSWSVGRRDTVVIGAPWAYLLRLAPDAVDDAERAGTIFYPFHGWEGQHVRGDHDRLIAQIKQTEPGPVTVCLYWQEFNTPRIRRRYEKAGFRVICHGYRGFMWRRTDRRFLHGQLAELRRHRRVASNRLCSAVLYGALAGCETAVYGDPMVLEGEDPTFGGVARIRRQWPQLHGEAVDVRVAREVAEQELGTEYLARPNELRELLGWPQPGQVDRDAR